MPLNQLIKIIGGFISSLSGFQRSHKESEEYLQVDV